MQITTIGLDLAKSVFQIHGVDTTGQVVVRKSLRRSQMLPFFAKLPTCLVGMEACGTSHYWARELIKLGHEVRLLPPAYVKPYVKRGKTDAADAEAVCEAVTRPTMRFVPVKSPEQQAALSMHRTRDLLVKLSSLIECDTDSKIRAPNNSTRQFQSVLQQNQREFCRDYVRVGHFQCCPSNR